MTKNIFLVDDNIVWSILTKDLLRDFGEEDVNIEYAKNGEEGIKKYEEMEKVDLVMMDIRLPDISGAEANKKILEKHENANVFAFSMFPDKRHRDMMEEAGVHGFISKLPKAKQLSSDMIGALEYGR